GSVPHGPPSITRSMSFSTCARISSASDSGCASPAGVSVAESSGSFRSGSKAGATAGPGTRAAGRMTRTGVPAHGARRGAGSGGWDVGGRGEGEGVAGGDGRLQQAKTRIVDDRVLRDLGEVPAHEGQVVLRAEAADAPQPLERLRVVEMAAERVAGVGRIGDQ